VTFGHFLIKQVVEEVSRELTRVAAFVTLSPAPNFADWLNRERANSASIVLDEKDRKTLAVLDDETWWRSPQISDKVREPLLRGAAWYYMRARNRRGMPVDAVARFHLGNGARLERLDWLADTSERAIKQSHGLMVNYRYDLDYIEPQPRGLCAAACRRGGQFHYPPGDGAGARNRCCLGVIPCPTCSACLNGALRRGFPERLPVLRTGSWAQEHLRDQRLCAYDVGSRGVLLLFLRGHSLDTVHLPGGTIPPHDGHGPVHIALLDRGGRPRRMGNAPRRLRRCDRRPHQMAARRRKPLLRDPTAISSNSPRRDCGRDIERQSFRGRADGSARSAAR